MTFTVATARPDNFFAALLKLTALLALIGFALIFVATAEKAGSPSSVSCEHHNGAFDKGFSADFDIDRTDCRIPSIKNSPTVGFWGVLPYVGVRWSPPGFEN